MDAGRFWEIIETARASARRDRPFREALTDHLATFTAQDILEYYERFEKMHGALYRRDLWAAAYLIGGGCSDDSFIDFRAGLIAQGHDWYHKAAAPDSLAGHPAVAGARHPRCVTASQSWARTSTLMTTRRCAAAVVLPEHPVIRFQAAATGLRQLPDDSRPVRGLGDEPFHRLTGEAEQNQVL